MKVNKWTLGLAAVGMVTLPTLSNAEEKMSPVDSAVSSIVLSGYVDTSIHWNPGTGNANVPGYAYNSSSKSDGFNLNAFKLGLEKAMDETGWAAGYKAELLVGPNASTLGTLSTSPLTGTGDAIPLAIKQAYVNFRVDVGTGLDVKVGVFDTIIGYEGTDSVANPNYTRSYGYSIEPTTHTGFLAAYRFSPMIMAKFGMANSYGPAVGGTGSSLGGASTDRAWYVRSESYKTYMGAVELTAPENFGFLKGSTLYAGVINGFNGGSGTLGTGAAQHSFYVGSTLKMPVDGLMLGASYDYAGTSSQAISGSSYANAAALYASFQIPNTKWSIHGRGEYFWQSENAAGSSTFSTINPSKVFAATGTVQYDLWKNVTSRLEVRWDHAANGDSAYGGTVVGTPTKRNNVLVAANFIYKF